MDATSVVFSVDELWLLQGVVRHEMAQGEGWKFPPVSVDLNDSIAEALCFIEDCKAEEAAILLTRGDCLLIDFCVPQSAKSPGGAPIGKQVLMKSFRARSVLRDEQPFLEAPEPEFTNDMRERMRVATEED